jgi:hypothetical protein
VEVEIFNMRGERIMSGSFTDEKSHGFSLNGEAAGVYFVKVHSGNDTEFFKLILSR